MRKVIQVLSILFLFYGCSNPLYKVTVPVQLQSDQALNEAEEILIQKGIQEHDAGNYEEAKRYYLQILEQKPYSAITLHELALTLNEYGKLDESLIYSKTGQQVDSQFRPYFYHFQGISLDYLGKTEQAIKAFQEGIKINNEIHYLHYSLAISLLNLGETDQAIISLENSLRTNFEHSSSHYMLGDIHFSRKSWTKSLLSYTYFLMFEPDSPRSQVAFDRINKIFNSAEKGDKPNQVNIGVNLFGGGEFSAIDLMIGINSATRYSDEKKDISDMEFISDGYEFVLSTILETRDENESETFITQYYLPYLEAVQKDGYTKMLIYLIFETSLFDGVSEWIDENIEQRDKFYKWEPFPEESGQ